MMGIIKVSRVYGTTGVDFDEDALKVLPPIDREEKSISDRISVV
jgi:hypothetical protein